MRPDEPEAFAGDFANPEHGIPREPLTDERGRPIPWEVVETMNDNWGYCAMDHNNKSPAFFIRALVNCVSKGGNLMLNVGPDARGRIPEESLRILSEIGKWMDGYGGSIFGCGPAGLDKPEWGRFTRRGDTVYAQSRRGHIPAAQRAGYGRRSATVNSSVAEAFSRPSV